MESVNASLAQQRNANLFKVKAHTRGVNRFQQFRPSLAMDFDRRSDNALRQLSMVEHGDTAPWPSAALVFSQC
jgi:hypothetical protein